MPGLTGDLVTFTEFGHGTVPQLVLKDKAKFFVHNTARFPWHALVLHAIAKVLAVSGMLPACSVRDVPGLYLCVQAPPPPCFLSVRNLKSVFSLKSCKIRRYWEI